jgi:alpha-L-fucosidase 2
LEGISYLDSNGRRQLLLSSSPEINNNNLDAWFRTTTNYDLSLMKFVFGKGAELAAVLGFKQDVGYWEKIAAQLPGYALSDNNELLYAPGYPYKESHRHFSHAMAIHPLSLVNWEDGEKERKIITNTLTLLDTIGPDNWNGYSYSWLANLKARAKDGEGAAKALEIFANAFCSVNSFHVNGDQSKQGYSKRTYRPFTLEGNFAFASAVQEMLLQSHAGFIDVMPALPLSWNDVSFKTLRAEGAFLVSAERTGGLIKKVKIQSEKGGVAKLKLPAPKFSVNKSTGAKMMENKHGFAQFLFQKGGVVELSF